jgi:hypothetical protein
LYLECALESIHMAESAESFIGSYKAKNQQKAADALSDAWQQARTYGLKAATLRVARAIRLLNHA